MESSAQRIQAERRTHNRKLLMWLGSILVLALVVGLAIWFGISGSLRPKWLASVGLVLDVIGAGLVALPLFNPYRDPVKEGMQFLSYYEPHRSAAVLRHQEKLTLPMQVGAALFISGFIFQLLSQWA
jgi:hypothetical protein